MENYDEPEHLIDYITNTNGEYEHLYDCEQCGDSVISFTLDTKGMKASTDNINAVIKEYVDNPDDISDGYHTFGELYEYRKLYNAAFFNELARRNLYNVHKSTKHSDGKDCFDGGWFIVMADLPTGQVSNHYEIKDWDLFDCQARETAEPWDGHTPKEAAERIEKYLKSNGNYKN